MIFTNNYIKRKNALSNPNALLLLIEIEDFPTVGSNYRFVNNNDDIVYLGDTFVKSSFELGTIDLEANGANPELQLNMNCESDFLKDLLNPAYSIRKKKIIVKLIANEEITGNTNIPAFIKTFYIKKEDHDEQKFTFYIGNTEKERLTPKNKILKAFCRYPFAGLECGYAGMLSSINFTDWTYPTDTDWSIEDNEYGYETVKFFGDLVATSEVKYNSFLTFTAGETYKIKFILTLSLGAGDVLEVHYGSETLTITEVCKLKEFEITHFRNDTTTTFTLRFTLIPDPLSTSLSRFEVSAVRVYNNALTCNKTYLKCSSYNNQKRFGGFLGVLDPYLNV